MKADFNKKHVQLFDRAKLLYKDAENGIGITPETENELKQIRDIFERENNPKGVVFCKKAMSIYHEKKAALANGEDQANHLKAAHELINEAIAMGRRVDFPLFALLKRQAIIKAKVAFAEHEAGNHDEASFLEADAAQIFGGILFERWDYGEVHLEFAKLKLSRQFWQMSKALKKILPSLDNAKKLYERPRHTQHMPTYDERANSLKEIAQMEQNIESIISHFKERLP